MLKIYLSRACLFALFMVFFHVCKLIWENLSFFFLFCAFGVLFNKLFPILRRQKTHNTFSSYSLKIWLRISRFLDVLECFSLMSHKDLILFRLIFSHMNNQFFLLFDFWDAMRDFFLVLYFILLIE